MTISPEADKAARLSAVVALIEQRVEHSERSGLLAFAASYFHRIDPEDIATRDVEDLYGALLSHWQFAQRREPGAFGLGIAMEGIAGLGAVGGLAAGFGGGRIGIPG
jgi:glutamate dehydrogenase